MSSKLQTNNIILLFFSVPNKKTYFVNIANCSPEECVRVCDLISPKRSFFFIAGNWRVFQIFNKCSLVFQINSWLLLTKLIFVHRNAFFPLAKCVDYRTHLSKLLELFSSCTPENWIERKILFVLHVQKKKSKIVIKSNQHLHMYSDMSEFWVPRWTRAKMKIDESTNFECLLNNFERRKSWQIKSQSSHHTFYISHVQRSTFTVHGIHFWMFVFKFSWKYQVFT